MQLEQSPPPPTAGHGPQITPPPPRTTGSQRPEAGVCRRQWDHGPHTSPWLLLQLADSAFPTGGFVHSNGLESAAQLGAIAGADDLERYVVLSLDQYGHTSLPFVSASHAGADLAAMDQLCEAVLINHLANRASRAQGSAWLTAANAAAPTAGIQALQHRVRDEALPGHQAPILGAVTALLGVDHDQVLRLALFQHLRALVSSAVRLSLVGPLAAQALQARCAEAAEATLARCRDLDPEDAAATCPLLDIWHAQHDRLYSRLFAS